MLNVATTRSSPLYATAGKAHDTARAILPRIANLSEGDRTLIDGKMNDLRSRLDQMAATFAKVEPYSVAVAS